MSAHQFLMSNRCMLGCRRRLRHAHGHAGDPERKMAISWRADCGVHMPSSESRLAHSLPDPTGDTRGSHERGVQQPSAFPRRTVLGSFAVLPGFVGALEAELSQWEQEVQLYWRRLVGGAQQWLPDPHGAQDAAQRQAPSRRPLDAPLAATLLAAPLRAAEELLPGWSAESFQLEVARLAARELPYWQNAGACGHCGAAGPSEGAFTDADWLSFVSYCQLKAVCAQLPPPPAREAAGEEVSRRVGELVLQHALASEVGTSKEVQAALANTSPTLDSFRRGLQSLLTFFVRAGLVHCATITQCGLSLDEYENHQVWMQGEPAYLTFLLTDPATARGARALEAEEGLKLDWIGSALTAYLAHCGVQATGERRFYDVTLPTVRASVVEPQVLEQWTLHRTRAASPDEVAAFDAGTWVELQLPWSPCPGVAKVVG